MNRAETDRINKEANEGIQRHIRESIEHALNDYRKLMETYCNVIYKANEEFIKLHGEIAFKMLLKKYLVPIQNEIWSRIEDEKV